MLTQPKMDIRVKISVKFHLVGLGECFRILGRRNLYLQALADFSRAQNLRYLTKLQITRCPGFKAKFVPSSSTVMGSETLRESATVELILAPSRKLKYIGQ
jgi:hypothetical protein